MRARIAGACLRSGRDPAEVMLVAASKYTTAEGIRELAVAGQVDFGENRVQDAVAKVASIGSGPALNPPLAWHLIGHLQANKAKAAVETFDIIQSVDSLDLAGALAARAKASGRRLPVLLQVNVDADPGKHGLYTASLEADYERIAALEGLRVDGLMTIGAAVATAEAARPTFRALREMRDRLDRTGLAPRLRHLSMGMSGDFEVAIEEGATIVRVGRALFDGELE